MKNLCLIFAAGLLIFSSCSRQDTVVRQQAITFGAYSGRAVDTKAGLPVGNDVVKDYNLDKGYYVQAWYDGKEYFNDKFTNNNAKSAKNKVYYWPTDIADKKMSFYAAATSGDSKVTISPEHKVTFDTGDGWNYELVVAKAEDIASTGPVSLSLKHALSKISKFYIKAKEGDPSATADYKYEVENIYITGFQKATYNLKESLWVLPESGDPFGYKYNDCSFAGNEQKDMANVPDDAKIRALIPQTFELSLKYVIKYKDYPIFGPVAKSGSLTLLPGKDYSITVSLSNDNDPIIFTATVTEWITEEKSVTVSTVTP